MKKYRYSDFMKELFLWAMTLVVLLPIFLVLLNSIKTRAESNVMDFSIPGSIHFENYMEVILSNKMYFAFVNSFIISFFSVIIIIVVSSMAAFVLSRKRSKSNNFIYRLFLLGLLAPMNMVTTFQVLKFLHIINTFQGIILLFSAMFIPFSIFLYYGFISGVPKELDEAGIIDGCNGLNLFFKIIMPLLKPVTVTVFILNFLYTWNDFTVPFYFLNSSTKWGMILTMYGYLGTFYSQWNKICVVITLTISPILIVYIIGQKYIISGMTAGSVKG